MYLKFRTRNVSNVVDASTSGPDADRLKVTLATGYFISRLAFSCLLQHDTYAQVSYQGKSMLHWCMREVNWGTRWLLKTHAFSGAQRPDTWGAKDKFVVQVRHQCCFALVLQNALILCPKSAPKPVVVWGMVS
jgi:hypothetical protein